MTLLPAHAASTGSPLSPFPPRLGSSAYTADQVPRRMAGAAGAGRGSTGSASPGCCQARCPHAQTDQGHELNSARLSPEVSEVSDRGDALLTADTKKCSPVLSPKQPGVTAGCSSFPGLDHTTAHLLQSQHFTLNQNTLDNL